MSRITTAALLISALLVSSSAADARPLVTLKKDHPPLDLGPKREIVSLSSNGRTVAAVIVADSQQYLEITFASGSNELLRRILTDPDGAEEITEASLASNGDGYLLVYSLGGRIHRVLFSADGDQMATGTLPALNHQSGASGSVVWHRGEYQLFWAARNDVRRFRISPSGENLDTQWTSVLNHRAELLVAEVEPVNQTTLLLVVAEPNECRIACVPTPGTRYATLVRGDETPLPAVKLSHEFAPLRSLSAGRSRLARTTPTVAFDTRSGDLHLIEIVGTDTLASRLLRGRQPGFYVGYSEQTATFDLMFSMQPDPVGVHFLRTERYAFSGRLLSTSAVVLPGPLAYGPTSATGMSNGSYAVVYTFDGRLYLGIVEAGRSGRTRGVQHGE